MPDWFLAWLIFIGIGGSMYTFMIGSYFLFVKFMNWRWDNGY